MYDLLNSTPSLTTLLCLTLGLLVGSFLNVVIYRLPEMMKREWNSQCKELLETNQAEEYLGAPLSTPFNLAVPRSRCPDCGHEIRAYENIPVISYLLLRGRCSSCKNGISARYPLLEMITGLLSGYIAYVYGFSALTLALLILTWVLIALTMIDFDHQLLPDNMTLPLLWLGLMINSQNLITDLSSAFWGAVLGYLALWSVYWAFKLATGKEGMGYGDFKLLAALGAWVGWQMLPLIILLSSLVGAIIGIALIALKGRDHSQPMPFGPFLAIAGWIALIWGQAITDYYWQFLT
nr:A24 family peptidase [Motiliproteus sp. MSK22-1]